MTDTPQTDQPSTAEGRALLDWLTSKQASARSTRSAWFASRILAIEAESYRAGMEAGRAALIDEMRFEAMKTPRVGEA